MKGNSSKFLLLWWLFCAFFLLDLDDTEQNEKLKLSIVMRLPEVTLNFGTQREFLPVLRTKAIEDLTVVVIGHKDHLNFQFLHLLLMTCGVPDLSEVFCSVSVPRSDQIED